MTHNIVERYELTEDLRVFGNRVEDFPKGIERAFRVLADAIPDGLTRSYYGLSYLVDGKMEYYVTVEEKSKGEAEKYGYPTHTIKKGSYSFIALKDWRSKTHLIHDIFSSLSDEDFVSDKNHPLVEWYKNENEMLCMVREQQ